MKRLFLGFGALFLVFLLAGCGNTKSADTSSKQSVMLTLANNSATLKNGEAEINFDTNKGATYSATDAETGDKLLSNTKAKTGSVTITANSAGTYEIKVTYKGKNKKALFVVKPGETESASSESSSDEPLAFGESDMVGNDSNVAIVSVESVKQVDPNDVMVTDISHNYDTTKQYCIVTYKVAQMKGTIDLNQFDGSELSFADEQGTTAITSSNRDNGVPDTLQDGENATLRIGIGLEHVSNKITVHFGGLTWKGNITK